MLKQKENKNMKENLPLSNKFEGTGSPWRTFHSSWRHAISSPLMTSASCLGSHVNAFNVDFACLL